MVEAELGSGNFLHYAYKLRLKNVCLMQKRKSDLSLSPRITQLNHSHNTFNPLCLFKIIATSHKEEGVCHEYSILN